MNNTGAGLAMTAGECWRGDSQPQAVKEVLVPWFSVPILHLLSSEYTVVKIYLVSSRTQHGSMVCGTGTIMAGRAKRCVEQLLLQ